MFVKAKTVQLTFDLFHCSFCFDKLLISLAIQRTEGGKWQSESHDSLQAALKFGGIEHI